MIKKQELILFKDKQSYNFMILGFTREQEYGEIYVTDHNRRTSIYRGSDVKEVIKLAKRKSRSSLLE
ncbi:hypothetical protein LCM10_04925 [Rossellomorea aquimaris]|uniref:hypothetical protein n=1 Tax=Rossellomorea aquimaris TaxID=189382 RepID=UPI001CD38104|nr:hypothetical protein [Rossellomorea aquimaris]MCA1054322.1 hypothetical protein [Rossellomorea aquimaris]